MNVIPFTAKTLDAFILLNFSFRNGLQFNVIFDAGVSNLKQKDVPLQIYRQLYKKPQEFGLQEFHHVDYIFLSHDHADHRNLLKDIVKIIAEEEDRPLKSVQVLLTRGTYYSLKNELGGLNLLPKEHEFDIPHAILKIQGEFIPSGHINGAVMVFLNVNGIRVLYTGDFNTERKRDFLTPLSPTELQGKFEGQLHLLITEATNCSINLKDRIPSSEAFRRLCELIGFTCDRSEKICIISSAWTCIPEVLDLCFAIRNYARAVEQELELNIRNIPIYVLDVSNVDFEREQYAQLSMEKEFLDITTSETPGKDPYKIGKQSIIQVVSEEKLYNVTGGSVVVLPNTVFWTTAIENQVLEWDKDPGNKFIFLGDQHPTPRYNLIKDRSNTVLLHYSNHAGENVVIQLIGSLAPANVFVTHYDQALADTFRQFLQVTFKGKITQRFYNIGNQIGGQYRYKIYDIIPFTHLIPQRCYQLLNKRAAKEHIDWQIYFERLLNEMKGGR